jgi:uncharacterized protein
VSDRRRLYAWLGFVGLFAAINYAARFAGGRPDRNVLYTWAAVVLELLQLGIILAVVLAIARGRPRGEYLGLRRPRSWRTAAWLVGAVVLGVFALARIISPFLDPGKEQGLVPERWQPQHAAAFVANFVVLALLVPIGEEITFRGLGYKLLERFGRTAAILLVGVAFGLAHGLVEALPILVPFGAGLAYVRARTGSIYPGVVVHGFFNGAVLLLAVA